MAIAANTGTATATAKISDINALITAINTELALYATKASVDALTVRVKALEDKVPTSATKDELGPLRDFDLALEQRVNDRLGALENKPAPADLTERVAALEAIITELRTPAAVTSTSDPMSTVPTTRRPRDPSEGVELIYDKATLYYGDMELHALRTAESTWRLVAQLNYITVNQIIWTYDETIQGTPAEVYTHASARLIELARLKTSHDAAHKRVREMSEGRP